MANYASDSEVRSELIRSLRDWWVAHRGDDIPDRADLNPLALKHLLPNLMISDVELDPFRIRYRLVGTRVAEATGVDFTGRCLDELVPGNSDEPGMAEYRTAYETRRPILGVSKVRVALGAQYEYEYGIFPLRKGGTEIAQFVALEDYFNFSHLHQSMDPWRVG